MCDEIAFIWFLSGLGEGVPGPAAGWAMSGQGG